MGKLLVVFLLLAIICQIERAASQDAKPKAEIQDIVKEVVMKMMQSSTPKIETKPESKPHQEDQTKPHPASPPPDEKHATREQYRKKGIIKGFNIPLGILKSLQDTLSS